MSPIGVVTIGRNEGERLIRCFQSLLAQVPQNLPIVYVDSGSSDGSCEAARQLGIEVVNLDLSKPFTAARARNAGFAQLIEQHPEIEWVQFIDGDCELVSGWLEAAIATFKAQPEVVAVCGWRKERYPERTLYNRICSVEWRSVPVGITTHFAGDVTISARALAAVGGYDENVIAAEDDELSIRLRQAGGQLLRLDRDCALHDADMHRFSQWWQRSKRCGYAFAQVSSLHGASPERKFVRELSRTWLWGLVLPLLSLGLSLPTKGLSLLLWGRYPLTALRVAYQTQKRGFTWLDGWAWGISCSLASFPAVLGAMKFYRDRWAKNPPKIIEYKGAATPANQI